MNTKSFWKKAGLLAMTAVAAAAFVTGCGSDKGKTAAAPAGAKGKEVVEFRYPEWTYYDLVYLADDLGYFKDAGVKPKYMGKIAPGQFIPSLVSGNLDVVTRHTPLVIAAVAQGADIKIFAGGSMSTKANPHMKYFVKADSPIHSVKDLAGKTIGFNSFGACSEYVTKKYLSDNGVDPKSLKFKTAPDEQQELALSKGDVDLAIIHPLASGRTAANTKDFRMLFSDFDIDGGVSGMCPYSVNGKFAKEHPEAVKELTAILSKAAKWNNEHPEEAKKLMAKRFGFKLEETEMFEFYPDQLVPEKNIVYWIDRLVAEGKLPEGKLKPSDIYTNEYNPAAK